MSKGLVTVFGGSGFVGKHVVRALVKDGWRVRVPCRRPHTAQDLRVIGNVGQIQLMQANIRFKDSVLQAVRGSDAVINLVSILFQEGKQKFDSVHMGGAENLVEACQAEGISNFVQISAIGADTEADSQYAQTKAEAEAIIKAAIPTADIVRPSIIFGPEDQFFNRFAQMASMAPALPLIGGNTKFQPVYAGDVAQAIAKLVGRGTSGETYELGGPRVYSFKELMNFVNETTARKRFLVPVPWIGASILGMVGEIVGYLPFVKPFLTRDQVANLKVDNVVGQDAKGFSELGIDLETIESIVPPYLERYRKHGQFHEKTS